MHLIPKLFTHLIILSLNYALNPQIIYSFMHLVTFDH